MAIAIITNFLLKPNLASGLHLYKKFIKNDARLLYYQEEIYSLDELVEELSDFNKIATEPVLKEKKNKKDWPPEIAELDMIAGNAWKERNYLRATILQEHDELKRKEMAFKILDNTDVAFDTWNKIKHWESTGELPFKAVPVILNDDLLTVIDKIKNIPAYLSKIKKKLTDEKPEGKRYLELLDQKAKHTADLQAARNRLIFLNEKIIELCL